jgi:EAL and modified HD-GYP domain-containing signal transduction protein
LARQPIFDVNYHVAGYELLYRDAGNLREAQFVDGDKATCRLLSDAITTFGLSKLTNTKPAFVNFTDTLILNDFVRLAKPQEVVVEVLENVLITDTLLDKLKELKSEGYQLAMDDYTGQEQFQCLLPIVDIVKVDFRLTDHATQMDIAQAARKHPNITLLAEKVETQEEFEWARMLGYRLFQGYFFAKPVTMHQEAGTILDTSYMRLLMELNRPGGIDFDSCANIIRTDAALTYRILRQVQKLAYYRGNLITAIQQALVVLGLDEVRRWALLVLARDNNTTNSEELVRKAYLRGTFTKKLMGYGPEKENAEHGFLLGMFSLLDQILGMNMEELLQDVELPAEVAAALLQTEENYYSRLLQCVANYESHSNALDFLDVGISLSDREIARLYMDSLVETDRVFSMTDSTTEGSA